MDLKENNINIKNEFNLLVKDEELINEIYISKVNYLVFLLDQLLLEHIERKIFKIKIYNETILLQRIIVKKQFFYIYL